MEPVLQKLVLAEDRLCRIWMRRARHFEFNWHFHPEYELTLITRGRGTRLVGDDVDEYHAGDLILLGPELPHSWASSTPEGTRPGSAANEACVLQFSSAFIGADWLRQPELAGLARLFARSSRGLQFTGPTRDRAAEAMLAAVELAGMPQWLRLLELFEFLAHSREGQPLASARYSARHAGAHRRQVTAIYQYLHEHFLEKLNLAEVARRFHLSPSTFHRLFRRSSGMTFTEFINELRVSHACNLLASGDLSISDICYQSGFNNLSHFYRKFEQLKKCTPRRYRAYFAAGG